MKQAYAIDSPGIKLVCQEGNGKMFNDMAKSRTHGPASITVQFQIIDGETIVKIAGADCSIVVEINNGESKMILCQGKEVVFSVPSDKIEIISHS